MKNPSHGPRLMWFLFLKKGREENTRLILYARILSICNKDFKLYARVLNKRLNKYFRSFSNRRTKCFQVGHSCADAVYTNQTANRKRRDLIY